MRYIILLIIFHISFSLGQAVQLNEIVSSNGDNLYDEDGETPDWIEIKACKHEQSQRLLATFGELCPGMRGCTCETRCISDCEASCPDAKVCSDNEVDCGEGPPHPSGFCEADRACVAKNCECKYTFIDIPMIIPKNFKKSNLILVVI